MKIINPVMHWESEDVENPGKGVETRKNCPLTQTETKTRTLNTTKKSTKEVYISQEGSDENDTMCVKAFWQTQNTLTGV